MIPTTNQSILTGYRRGQTMPELAIAATVLCILLFAIIEMGIVIYDYNMVCSAAREAVRYAIVHPTDSSGIKNAAINSAPFLSASNITVNTSVTDPNPNGATNKDAQVTISYPYTLQIPLVPSISLTLSSTSQMMRSQ
jgi:Flp pilus assembly protein TadG